jgi:hypothetical protein
MEKWIILYMQKERLFKNKVFDLQDVAVCDDLHGNLLVFDSLDQASNYQEDHGISGQCIELPIY